MFLRERLTLRTLIELDHIHGMLYPMVVSTTTMLVGIPTGVNPSPFLDNDGNDFVNGVNDDGVVIYGIAYVDYTSCGNPFTFPS